MNRFPGELELSRVTKVNPLARLAHAESNSIRPDGAYYVAKTPNAFGLPALTTCPGKTKTCQAGCYALESERRTATYEKLVRNYNKLRVARTSDLMAEKLIAMLGVYDREADKQGLAETNRNFRIHWDGDFFNEEYALAWRMAIKAFPHIKFWAYTRSFTPECNVIQILDGLPNLDLFLSVDKDNVDIAEPVLRQSVDAKVAYLVEYYEDFENLAQQLGSRGLARNLACPENMKNPDGSRRLSLISERGGACARCTYCIDKRSKWDVVFVTTGLMFNPVLTLDGMDYDNIPKVKVSPEATALGSLVTLTNGNGQLVDLSAKPAKANDLVVATLF